MRPAHQQHSLRWHYRLYHWGDAMWVWIENRDWTWNEMFGHDEQEFEAWWRLVKYRFEVPISDNSVWVTWFHRLVLERSSFDWYYIDIMIFIDQEPSDLYVASPTPCGFVPSKKRWRSLWMPFLGRRGNSQQPCWSLILFNRNFDHNMVTRTIHHYNIL